MQSSIMPSGEVSIDSEGLAPAIAGGGVPQGTWITWVQWVAAVAGHMWWLDFNHYFAKHAAVAVHLWEGAVCCLWSQSRD